jgi:hypothetical protein
MAKTSNTDFINYLFKRYSDEQEHISQPDSDASTIYWLTRATDTTWMLGKLLDDNHWFQEHDVHFERLHEILAQNAPT